MESSQIHVLLWQVPILQCALHQKVCGIQTRLGGALRDTIDSVGIKKHTEGWFYFFKLLCKTFKIHVENVFTEFMYKIIHNAEGGNINNNTWMNQDKRKGFRWS